METTTYHRIPYLGTEGGGSIIVPYRPEEIEGLWPWIDTFARLRNVGPYLLLSIMLVETALDPDPGPRFWRPLPPTRLKWLLPFWPILATAPVKDHLWWAAETFSEHLDRYEDPVTALAVFHLGSPDALAKATTAELMALEPYVRGVIATAAWLVLEAPKPWANQTSVNPPEAGGAA